MQLSHASVWLRGVGNWCNSAYAISCLNIGHCSWRISLEVAFWLFSGGSGVGWLVFEDGFVWCFVGWFVGCWFFVSLGCAHQSQDWKAGMASVVAVTGFLLLNTDSWIMVIKIWYLNWSKSSKLWNLTLLSYWPQNFRKQTCAESLYQLFSLFSWFFFSSDWPKEREIKNERAVVEHLGCFSL